MILYLILVVTLSSLSVVSGENTFVVESKDKFNGTKSELDLKLNLIIDEPLTQEQQMNHHDRTKRSLANLYNMMERNLKCANTIWNGGPLAYNGHGNWCGSGGSGATKDAIDMCCRAHDLCYDNTKKGSCASKNVYLLNYDWQMHRGGGRPGINTIICNDKIGSCKFSLCECDFKFIRCLEVLPCPK